MLVCASPPPLTGTTWFRDFRSRILLGRVQFPDEFLCLGDERLGLFHGYLHFSPVKDHKVLVVAHGADLECRIQLARQFPGENAGFDQFPVEQADDAGMLCRGQLPGRQKSKRGLEHSIVNAIRRSFKLALTQ